MSVTDSFPVLLSLQVATTALAVVVPVGLAVAYRQTRRPSRWATLIDGAVLLPLVLPPSVVGFLLVTSLGRGSPVGRWLDEALGLQVVFTPLGAVIAASLVALPLMVKTAQPALAAVPRDLEEVGRTLGLTPAEVFFRITLRQAWPGLLAGCVLAFARALGEFGATLMLAGMIPGKTNTMALEIFAAWEMGDTERAGQYVLLLTALSVLVVLVAARLTPREVER